MTWPKIDETHYCEQLGILDKDHAFKGLVVCNSWDVSAFGPSKRIVPTSRCYQPSPVVWRKKNYYMLIKTIHTIIYSHVSYIFRERKASLGLAINDSSSSPESSPENRQSIWNLHLWGIFLVCVVDKIYIWVDYFWQVCIRLGDHWNHLLSFIKNWNPPYLFFSKIRDDISVVSK